MYSYDMYVTFCNTLHPPFLAPLPLAHVALDPEAHVPPTQNNRHAAVKIHTSRISMLGELEMSMPTLSSHTCRLRSVLTCRPWMSARG